MTTNNQTRYRVFIAESEHYRLPAGVTVEETYPAFAVVRASPDAIEECRKAYPLEPLGEPKGPPAVPDLPALAGAARDSASRGPYTLVLRFRSPLRPEWLEEIVAKGCRHLSSMGSSSIVVQCPSKRTRSRLAALPYVASVRPYVPEIKISDAFFDGLGEHVAGVMEAALDAALQNGFVPADVQPTYVIPGLLVVTFFEEADRQAAQRALSRQKVRGVTEVGATDLIVDLAASTAPENDLTILAGLRNLRSLEEKTVDTILNNRARALLAERVLAAPPAGPGLTGRGEIVAVADTGLDTGDLATLHADLRDRVAHLESFPFSDLYQSLVTNPQANDGAADVHSGHGTHVCGSVLGTGARSNQLHLGEHVQGTAPEAALVFQAIEQSAEWSDRGKLFWLRNGKQPPKGGLFAIPADLQVLFKAAFSRGARIHSISWGASGPNAWGDYNPNSLNLDRFVWDHPEFLVVVAAGNEAEKTDPPRKPGSVISPGTAKNCLTVGACGNGRNGHRPSTIAPFSSRGPTIKGRLKPDVVAPGMDILSTRSSLSSDSGWGEFEDAPDTYVFNGGTSMATPLVAGCAALVRQHLRETVGMAQPSAALVKAALIHAGQYHRSAGVAESQHADNEQGWGRVDLATVLAPAAPARVLFVDEREGPPMGHERVFRVQVDGPEASLRATLAYSDFPGPDLVNNLNLFLVAPNGSFFVGNDFDGDKVPDSQNNVEGIVVAEPQPGEWTLRVVASNVPQQPQGFALVVSAAGLQRVE